MKHDKATLEAAEYLVSSGVYDNIEDAIKSGEAAEYADKNNLAENSTGGSDETQDTNNLR
ncbi:MAG: hypothetical protein R3341_09965 [Methylophaga sp.]|nr:hypothetical protein [Methylophaga sp.]